MCLRAAARSQTWEKTSSRNQLQLFSVDNVIKVKAAAKTAHASYLEPAQGAQRACQMTVLLFPERSSAAAKKSAQSPIIVVIVFFFLNLFLPALYRLFSKNEPENAVAKQLLTRLAGYFR